MPAEFLNIKVLPDFTRFEYPFDLEDKGHSFYVYVPAVWGRASFDVPECAYLIIEGSRPIGWELRQMSFGIHLVGPCGQGEWDADGALHCMGLARKPLPSGAVQLEHTPDPLGLFHAVAYSVRACNPVSFRIRCAGEAQP